MLILSILFRPLVHRAMRFGFNLSSLSILLTNGGDKYLKLLVGGVPSEIIHVCDCRQIWPIGTFRTYPFWLSGMTVPDIPQRFTPYRRCAGRKGKSRYPTFYVGFCASNNGKEHQPQPLSIKTMIWWAAAMRFSSHHQIPLIVWLKHGRNTEIIVIVVSECYWIDRLHNSAALNMPEISYYR